MDGSELVDLLRAYLNRVDLLYDLQETARQLGQALNADDTHPGASRPSSASAVHGDCRTG
jgi:hypothetical protein